MYVHVIFTYIVGVCVCVWWGWGWGWWRGALGCGVAEWWRESEWCALLRLLWLAFGTVRMQCLILVLGDALDVLHVLCVVFVGGVP